MPSSKIAVLGIVLAGASGCVEEMAPTETPVCEKPAPVRTPYLILTTDTLRSVAEEYAAWRGEGYDVTVTTVAEARASFPEGTLADAVTRAVAQAAPTWLFIIGDADSANPESLDHVPVATGTERLGDAPYADLDGDGLPDVNVGRLPVLSDAEARVYLWRAQEHESGYRPGPWNKRLSAFAGQAGFGAQIDGILEWAAGQIFDRFSYDFDMTMTYATSTSAFYLPEDLWLADWVARYNEGSLVQPFIGHGPNDFPMTDAVEPPRRTLLTFFACYDGTFQEGEASSDRMVRLAVGPIAGLGATTISTPYGNSILTRELSHAMLNLRLPTYGEVVTQAKRNMVLHRDNLRDLIDGVAGDLEPEPLDVTVAAHIVMYNLIGDPAAPVHLPPGQVVFDAPGRLTGGSTARVSGAVLADPVCGARLASGEITVSLEVERNVILGATTPNEEEDPTIALANHAIANDKVVTSATTAVHDGSFAVSLEVPTGLPSVTYYLKGYALDAEVDAVGSLAVPLSP